MRRKVAQIGSVSYEDSAMTSVAGLLASGDPAAALNQASLLQQQAGSRDDQVNVLLADGRQLTSVQQELQRTRDGIAGLKAQLAAHKRTIGQLLATQQATLDSLTSQQQTQVAAGAIGAPGTTSATYAGPTDTQAGKAVGATPPVPGPARRYGGTGGPTATAVSSQGAGSLILPGSPLVAAAEQARYTTGRIRSQAITLTSGKVDWAGQWWRRGWWRGVRRPPPRRTTPLPPASAAIPMGGSAIGPFQR